MFRFSSLPPLSLYIHFPWCIRKCPYCDFNSHEFNNCLPEQEYIDALFIDLEQDLPRIWGRLVTSIFMGGGTPSLFSPEALDRLLSGLRARLNLAADIEITLEANPGTVEQEKFSEFRAAGINRLSIGVQSFADDKLEKLGRIHNRKEAFRAAEAAHLAGFDNFNLDLMFALPDQTLDQALDDLRNAMALEPGHISHYQLTIEPNTWFYHHPPPLPDDDTAWEMQSRCQALFAEQGYTQYEVSAYARTDKQCQHNLNYWTFGDYLGIGAGAHDKISDASLQQISRSSKFRSPEDYLQARQENMFTQAQRVLTEGDVVFEFMLNALRLVDGFGQELFEQHTGLSFALIQPQLRQAANDDLIKQENGHICATDHGRQYLNDLTERFLPDD